MTYAHCLRARTPRTLRKRRSADFPAASEVT
jgi:hypothetical protein